MADSSLFGSVVASSMGSAMTPAAQAWEPWEQEMLKNMDPTLAGAMLLNRKREDVYNDPTRFRELLQVMTEERGREAERAAKIQAERDKRAFQYQMMAEIPRTITQTSANLAQMALNAPDLRIRAQIPELIRSSWGAFPEVSIPRGRGFS